MSMLVFWIVTPCGLVGGYHLFGGASESGITTQKTNIDNFTAVRS
jgi:hypothetical protein